MPESLLVKKQAFAIQAHDEKKSKKKLAFEHI